MKIRILRRRGLGNSSTKAIKYFSKNDIEIIRNDKHIPEDTDLLIRWGCTSKFPSKRTLNKVSSIQLANNKKLTRKVLHKEGVNVPEIYEELDDYIFPCIIRPENHSQGKHLYLCNDEIEVAEAILRILLQGKDSYSSEYIEKDAEYGVFIFNDRVWSVIEKTPKFEDANKEIAWNVAQGTHSFKNVKWGNWHMPSVIESLKAFRAIGLTFGRVDVMLKDNKPYILEINSAHSLTSEYRQECFAKCLDHYIENGPVKNDIDIDKKITFKSIIHPAIRKNKLGNNE